MDDEKVMELPINILTSHCINKQHNLLCFTLANIFYTWPGVCIVRKKKVGKAIIFQNDKKLGLVKKQNVEKICAG